MSLPRLASTAVLPLVLAVGLAACGSDAGGTDPAITAAPTASGGRSCPDVQVPGHQAVMLRATGADCEAAKAVAAAAEGRGRAPYAQMGFACKGTDADAGDTDYACSMGDARITFRYGTA